MRTFSVKNFEKFQHYKDRSPPWIRLYNSLLDDYEFGRLPDASKAHLIAIWLLASRYDNKIPFDAEWVSRRINATGEVDLAELAKAGFIIVDQSCSEVLAGRKQSDVPETETETEKETPSLRSGAKKPEDDAKPSRKRPRTSLPPDFEPNAAIAQALGLSAADAEYEAARFRDYAAQTDWQNVDWTAAWRNWCRKAARAPPRQPQRVVNGFAALGLELMANERLDETPVADDGWTGLTIAGN